MVATGKGQEQAHWWSALEGGQLAEGLHGGEGQCSELGVQLVSGSALGAVLPLHLLQRREGDAHDLEEDGGVDGGDDAEGEDSDVRDGATGDVVYVPEEAAAGHSRRELLDVDAGQSVVHADAGHGDEGDEGDDLVSELFWQEGRGGG